MTSKAPGRPVEFPDFEAMDIKIDAALERKKWDTLFTTAQIALRFCQFDHTKAEEVARKMIEKGDGGVISDLLARLSDSIDYFRDLAKLMECAGTRLAVSADRAQGRTIPKPRPSAVAKALARARAAQAAYDAAEAAKDDADLEHQFLVEAGAFDKLAMVRCSSDAEFIEKLRYMIAHEINLWGSPLDSQAEFKDIAVAAALHLGVPT